MILKMKKKDRNGGVEDAAEVGGDGGEILKMVGFKKIRLNQPNLTTLKKLKNQKRSRLLSRVKYQKAPMVSEPKLRLVVDVGARQLKRLHKT